MTDMRKLDMPDDDMVERGMTKAQRAEHQRKLAKWRERPPESEVGEDEDGLGR